MIEGREGRETCGYSGEMKTGIKEGRKEKKKKESRVLNI